LLSDSRRDAHIALPNARLESEMAVELGFILSGVIALGIIFIGVRFLVSPYSAAASYGVSVEADRVWSAYLSVKGVRDIASGLFIGLLLFNRSPHFLGWFMLVATLIPAVDAIVVLRHGGTKMAAFGIHGATAIVMLAIAGLLLMG
jgi:hypothetical protein